MSIKTRAKKLSKWFAGHSNSTNPRKSGLRLIELAEKKQIVYAMSRRRRSSIIIAVLLFVGAVIWLDHNHQVLPLQSESQRPLPNVDVRKYHQKTFTVVNVVDGDTLDIDEPDGKYNKTRVRLWGVDTPESKSPKYGVMYFGPEAAEFTTKLALGKAVTVYLDSGRTRGKYGRLLAYVKMADGRYLNEVLITEGFGYADVRFKHSFYNKYKQLQTSAKRNKKGLWKEVTQEQLPQWLQRNKPKLLVP